MFRRTYPEIRNPGGLWDKAAELYPRIGAEANETRLEYRFPSGATIQFSHLQHEKDKEGWSGSEVPLIEFDELTSFTESQFWFLLSRNRSLSGVRPYLRASCNPDPYSWVKRLLAPWVGGPDLWRGERAKSGEIKHLIRDGDEIHWVEPGTPDSRSITFVPARLSDNRILEAADPGYRANLKALPLVDRARLLDGDWDMPVTGNVFRYEWLKVVSADVPAPAQSRWCRFWDLAATEPKPGRTDPDYTVGVLLGIAPDRTIWIADVRRIRGTPGAVLDLIQSTAAADDARFDARIPVVVEQEPGSASKFLVVDLVKRLAGHEVRSAKPDGDKVERAKPLSAQAEAGNLRILARPWTHDLVTELAAFPNPRVHDDQVDACSGAYAWLIVSSKKRMTVA